MVGRQEFDSRIDPVFHDRSGNLAPRSREGPSACPDRTVAVIDPDLEMQSRIAMHEPQVRPREGICRRVDAANRFCRPTTADGEIYQRIDQ